MRAFGKRSPETVQTRLLAGGLFVAVAAVLALLTGAVMRLFGFSYRSPGSVVGFFLLATAVSLPLNLIAGALPKALLQTGLLGRKWAQVLYLLLDTFATAVGMGIADVFMESVSAPERAIWAVAFLLAIFGADGSTPEEEKYHSKGGFEHEQTDRKSG